MTTIIELNPPHFVKAETLRTIIKLIPTNGKKVFVKTEIYQMLENERHEQKTRVITSTQLLNNIDDTAAYIAVQQQQEKCEIVDYTGEYPPPRKRQQSQVGTSG